MFSTYNQTNVCGAAVPRRIPMLTFSYVSVLQPDVDADVLGEKEEEFLPPLSSLSNKYGSMNRHSEEDPQDVQGIADLKTLTVLAVGKYDVTRMYRRSLSTLFLCTIPVIVFLLWPPSQLYQLDYLNIWNVDVIENCQNMYASTNRRYRAR